MPKVARTRKRPAQTQAPVPLNRPMTAPERALYQTIMSGEHNMSFEEVAAKPTIIDIFECKIEGFNLDFVAAMDKLFNIGQLADSDEEDIRDDPIDEPWEGAPFQITDVKLAGHTLHIKWWRDPINPMCNGAKHYFFGITCDDKSFKYDTLEFPLFGDELVDIGFPTLTTADTMYIRTKDKKKRVKVRVPEGLPF
ncbi:hypothetical protein CYLTODRAFT_421584 [Cylindrobasidium torrendii FP15055 ss-10]|uniref:Uncharacterized protein n=1 Tax=Cylindrobasidium torrendii FP15055 ss-10 TaxID=1314674 RepID=A0A0D7BE56_9AGAR|nr:hypothetical protein CYLTODRAFT_421584 [Cylindrobasidium torrendii FP15055 ss-10]